ncbi:MAG: cytochrome C oxidase subunit IV family protein [Sphingobium sp.]
MRQDISPAPAQAPVAGGTQHHPIGLYLRVWGYLFLLSTLSYLVDYFNFQGIMRSTLIVTFMLLKAGLILSIFMHMAWERLSLIYAILVPPLVLIVLVGIMSIESDYVFWTRAIFQGGEG